MDTCVLCVTTLNRITSGANICYCNVGYFDNGSDCEKCNYSCYSCENLATNCTDCDYTYNALP